MSAGDDLRPVELVVAGALLALVGTAVAAVRAIDRRRRATLRELDELVARITP